MNARPSLRLVANTPIKDEPDALLVACLAQEAGARAEAAQEIMRRYVPMVQRILRRSLGPGDDIPDLVQDVFLCLFERVHELRKPEQLKSFVISVAINILRAQIKRRSVRRRAALDPSAFEWGDTSDFEPEGGHDARLAFVRFSTILDALDDTDRLLFVLRFMEELTLVEAAQAAGVSLATAKRRLSRGWEAVTAGVQKDPLIAEYLNNTVGQGRR